MFAKKFDNTTRFRSSQNPTSGRPVGETLDLAPVRLAPVRGKICRVHRIPVLQDNYVFVVEWGTWPNGDCLVDDSFLPISEAPLIVIDPGEAAPVIAYLEPFMRQSESRRAMPRKVWILLTHHHHDHVAGVSELRSQLGARLLLPGSLADRENISRDATDRLISCGEISELKQWGVTVETQSSEGHCRGHVRYWIPEEQFLFSGDTLFGLGCGRVFDGSMEELFQSLSEMRSLADETLVFCTHEYTASNFEFHHRQGWMPAELRDYVVRMRAKLENQHSTVPLELGWEKRANPFLKWDESSLARHLGLAQHEQGNYASGFMTFQELRLRKDRG